LIDCDNIFLIPLAGTIPTAEVPKGLPEVAPKPKNTTAGK